MIPVPDKKTDRKFLLLMMTVVVGLLLAGIFRHEMWRDELQAWCLARDSATLFEVQKHLQYEGHPISWYVPLYLFTRFTHDPLIMQLFNVVLTAGACYVVLAYSPFSRLQKILFCFGYFPLFEYGIISRSYSLELLALVGVCCLFRFRREHPWWLFSTLVFLSCTNAYGLMLSLAFTATVLLEYWLERKDAAFPLKVAAIGTVLVVAAAVVTVKQMTAPADGYHGELVAIKEEQPKRFFKSVRAVPIAYCPIPNVSEREFWNTDLISKIENEPLTYSLVIAVVSLCFLLLLLKPAALFLYGIGTGGLVFFSYTHLLGGLRQQGHLFLILLCSFWIATNVRSWEFGPPALRKLSSERARSIFLTCILFLQLIAGVYAYYQDLSRPFSSGKLVARFIKQKGLQDMLIIGSNDHEMPSISGYLDRKIFCPESGTYIGFVVNNTSRHNIEFDELSAAVRKAMESRHVNQALLILNYPLGAIPKGFKIEGLNQFDKSIQGDERFYVYRISRDSGGDPSGASGAVSGAASSAASSAASGVSLSVDRGGASTGASTGAVPENR